MVNCGLGQSSALWTSQLHTDKVHDFGSAGSFVFSQYASRPVCNTEFLPGAELHLMFSLMDKVPNGIEPMLKDLEDHIINAGLADMVAAAETITTVRAQTHTSTISQHIASISCQVMIKPKPLIYLSCKPRRTRNYSWCDSVKSCFIVEQWYLFLFFLNHKRLTCD